MLIRLIFPKGYEKFGLNVQPNGDIIYREWAPNALTATLIGEFSMCSLPKSIPELSLIG